MAVFLQVITLFLLIFCGFFSAPWLEDVAAGALSAWMADDELPSAVPLPAVSEPQPARRASAKIASPSIA